MLSILRQRTYRRLFLAHVVSLVGTGLATVALGLLAYGLAGARAGGVLGTALAIKMVAYVGVAPVAATLLEGRPRRTVLAVAQGVRLASALALPLVDQVWQVYLLIAVLQCASAVFTPTLSSVVPDVLPREEDYTSALSLTRVAADLESVLSPGLAAGLLLVLPAGRLFDITALGFAASALLIAGAGVPARAPGSREAPFWERVRRGAALFVRLRALRPVVALDVVVAAPCAFVLVHSVVLVRERLGLGEAALGVVLAVNGAGSMLVAALLPRLLEAVGQRRVMLTGAVVLVLGGVGETGLTLRPDAALAPALLATWLVVGAGWAAVEVPVGRIVRREVPDADLPAAFAADFSVSHACWLLTYPLVGWLGAASLPLAAGTMTLLAALGTVAAVRLWPPDAETTRLSAATC